MARLKADYDTWEAALDSHQGRAIVLFFCRSNDQRPYRVAAVDDGELPDADALEALSATELASLFERSESMNVTPS